MLTSRRHGFEGLLSRVPWVLGSEVGGAADVRGRSTGPRRCTTTYSPKEI